MYREYWEQARHCENERLWFTNIYAAVVAAILVFMNQASNGSQAGFNLSFLLAFFGLILSILGLLVVISVSMGYIHYITQITMIVDSWKKIEFHRSPKKPLHFMTIHRCFYEITIALFSVLTLSFICENFIVYIFVFVAVWAFSEGLYHGKWKKYFKKHHTCMQELQEGTKDSSKTK